MAETSVEYPDRIDINKSQSLFFPAALSEKANSGHPFIQFQIESRDKPENITVFLYQPPGVAIQDGATYTNFNLGALKGASEFVKGGVTSSDLNSSDMMAAGLIGKDALTSALGSDLVGKGTAIGALESGIAVNPYTRVAFEGVNIRTYDFTFKLVAESKDETEMAKRIERTFRKFLYPKRVGSIGLTYPPIFNIKFFSNKRENPYMPKIKQTYLTSLQTTFNESTNALFKETGAPFEVTLAMTFQEERTLVRQDLYEDDNTVEERDGYFES